VGVLTVLLFTYCLILFWRGILPPAVWVDYQPDLFTNHIPEKSVAIFALFSQLFTVYLLGAIFGRELLKAHHRLYKSKTEIENRIVEKETLLKEVHHRVKNNLQTVSSLLNLQAKNGAGEQFKALIKSSQNRVISMAMIHEMLYMRENVSKIEYSSYVTELGDYLIKSTDHSQDDIDFHVDIPDIQLGIDTAIPLGLLINEVITNSLKYGFEIGEKGRIEVNIRKGKDNNYVLRIGDDGKGFVDDINIRRPNSLGLRLIKSLTKQLCGTLEKDTSKKGTHYIIKFQDLHADDEKIAA